MGIVVAWLLLLLHRVPLAWVSWGQFSHEVRLRHRQGNPELKILFTIAMDEKKNENSITRRFR